MKNRVIKLLSNYVKFNLYLKLKYELIKFEITCIMYILYILYKILM